MLTDRPRTLVVAQALPETRGRSRGLPVLTAPIGAFVTVQHDAEHHRFVAQGPGGEAQLMYSYFADTVLNLEHTEVPPEARGHGVSDALIRAALAFARERSLNVVATCPFAQRWLAAHPDERPRPGPSS